MSIGSSSKSTSYLARWNIVQLSAQESGPSVLIGWGLHMGTWGKHKPYQPIYIFMNTCLYSDVPTSLEKSGMLKWKMCVCVSVIVTLVCACVSGRSDSLESPFMAQIISRIREPGQSESVTSVKHVLSGHTRRKRPADSNFNSIQTDMTSVFIWRQFSCVFIYKCSTYCILCPGYYGFIYSM